MSMVGNYRIMSKIGEGTYGVVYKAEAPHDEDLTLKNEPDVVAMKKIHLDDHQEGVPVTTLREVALLKFLCHENIVRLRDIIPNSPKLYLVFDFMDLDLKQCMDSHFRNGMPDALIKSCLFQILRGVAFCHSKLVLHRDLKPQNVLIDKEGRVKLADFGLARAFQSHQRYTHEVVTLWYRAPELLLGQEKYTSAVDLWSIGCIFAELACRRPLFPGDSEIDELFKIFRQLGTPTEAVWPGVGNLPDYQTTFPRWAAKEIAAAVPRMSEEASKVLKRLLVYNPTKRLSAEEALRTSYFDAVRDECALLSLAKLKPSTSPRTQLQGGRVACSSNEVAADGSLQSARDAQALLERAGVKGDHVEQQRLPHVDEEKRQCKLRKLNK